MPTAAPNPAIPAIASDCQRAELRCGHAEIERVVREEVAGRRLKNGEASTRHEEDRRHDQQRPAVADRSFNEAAIVLCQKRLLRLKPGSDKRSLPAGA
jgi:hypothetical protein